tara:strand:+ start:183 stop:932 length:750 start_codon:yes stop_codon:yes gene_type:complete
MSLSCLIIVRNEENNLEKCLPNLIFSDEIVVVLDRSTDNSKEISKKFSNSIFEGNWEFEGDRRNFGINKCSMKWILEVDADEIISKNLAEEIVKITEKSNYDYHYIKLINYIGNNPIKNGWMACLAPDGKFALFKKASKIWSNQRVHPDYLLSGQKGPVLKFPIDHYMSQDTSDLLIRFNRNTDLRALDIAEKNEFKKKDLSVRKIFSRFFKCYILRKGFKDGMIGFLISILCSLYNIISAIKSKYVLK